MDRRTTHSPRPRRRGRAGFTLVELLVVLVIVSIVAAVTLPVVIPAISHRQVSETARIIQGGLVAARDTALRSNSPHGIRFLPDPTYSGVNPATGLIDPYRTLASNRFIPIEQPPGYSEGSVCVPMSAQWQSGFANFPEIVPGVINSGPLYVSHRVRLLCQGKYRLDPASGVYMMDNPTSWYWNVRVGDKIQINQTGPFFTIVGPMDVDNPEKFVNVNPSNPALQLLEPGSTSTYFEPEILFVVNGLDDDNDGYIDNGRDGIDNDLNGIVDDLAEWSETEMWPPGFLSAMVNDVTFGNVLGHPHYGGVPYQIVRQPVPSPGARETILPDSVVVDLTGWALPQPERSRLPVDPLSGAVDILLDPGGRVIPTTRYSSPTSVGMNRSFHHIWVAERSDLAEINVTRNASGVVTAVNPLVSGYPFYLPMPLGMNREGDPEGPNAYDDLVNSNATLPYLKGEMRLLTLSTRTGNMITTDRPIFSVRNPSQPYHAPQLGEQGDAP
ncbi:prepilin-type N-terminal cleavage/methylation domain-containing protein [Paludisphaera sp.]|uniref:prepilin-type N-terminal cleavage/methylation domain-containing protein n=1 Tax=Paludisphaera sp. TaxID=2017432 RepID=UPI00301DDB1C